MVSIVSGSKMKSEWDIEIAHVRYIRDLDQQLIRENFFGLRMENVKKKLG